MQSAPRQNLRTPPKNPGLLELIRSKREWDWKPSAADLKKGFRGWHQRGFLPHFDAPNVTQMVTFMLADSFPVERRREWEIILKESDNSIKRRQLEAWLGRGHGQCWLRRPDVAAVVEQALLERNKHHFEMQAWVVMPNHVHLIVDVWDTPLSKLIGLWKGKSAFLANRLLGRHGQFWQEDYFDTLIRDETHLKKAIHYTENNPTKALLVKSPRDWTSGSARMRDSYERLP
jgi:REP element-mobilizing transposase RayT